MRLIFGISELAKIADAYLPSNGFIASKEFITSDSYWGRPVYCLDDFNGAGHEIFIPVAYKNQNRDREKAFNLATERGFKIISYIHPTAHKTSSVNYGEGLWINPLVNIDPYVNIGRGVTCWNLAHLGHSSSIGDFCWITTGAVICGQVKMNSRVFVGANAVVAPGVTIGEGCVISALAFVTRDMEPNTVALEGRNNFIQKRADKINL